MKIKSIAILMALILALSITACGNRNRGNESTTDEKININGDQPNDNTTNESNTNQNEETTTKRPTVDRESDPGEFTYIEMVDTVYVINKINSVTFRSGNFTALSEFKNGTVLQRIAISDDGRWSKVVVDGVEGYVATRNLSSYNPEDNNFEPCDLTLTVAKDKTLNVRISPEVPTGIDETDQVELDFNVAGQIFEGHTFKVVASNGEWYKIEYTPAEGTLAAGYNYEFFVKANNDYFVSVQNNGAN